MKDDNIRKKWEEFVEKHKQYFTTNEEEWLSNLQKVDEYIVENNKRPSNRDTNKNVKYLADWISNQQKNYKKKVYIMKDENIRNKWEEFVEKHKEYFKTQEEEEDEEEDEEKEKKEDKIVIIPKKSMKLKINKDKETKQINNTEQKRERVISEISQLHQKYKTMKSENLQKAFQENPELWHKYHEISEANEESFPEDETPRNRIIKELNKIKTRRTKLVVDMGCGKGQISQHFDNDKRFQFINYDHISSNETIISCDISNTLLEEDSVEICILSLAMWGSNCKEYIKEANRILESGGKIYIIEPTKRWSEQDDLGNIITGKEGSKMKSLLEENGFQIVEQSIEKFCMFVCIKV